MRLYGYQLKLKQGGSTRSGILIHREGNAWGEASPLPGWNRETFAEALHQLKHPPASPFYPSVSFGLESTSREPWTKSVPVAAFLKGSLSEIFEKAERCHLEGFTHAKVKISQLSIPEAFEAVNALKDLFKLRIDLNRAWQLKAALEFFSHFAPDSFDYIEEPLANPRDLVHFTHPFALDETLFEPWLSELMQLPLLKALIYKPTLQGGLSKLKAFLPFQKEIVLGGAFESGVGIFQIASLAQHLPQPLAPLGIDTYSFLEEDILETPLQFSAGTLLLPSLLLPKMSHLHEL